MKKHLLFVMPSLAAGGGEKSLINLLSQIDYKLYNVDLYLFNKTGSFFNAVPKEVNIVCFSKTYSLFTENLFFSVLGLLKCGQVKLAFYRFMFFLKNRTIKDTSLAEQYTWKYLRESSGFLDKEYDVAIGYLEKSPIYFVVDKVKAKKKIGWIHTNYSNSGMDCDFDNVYFEQLDNIITVSEECAKSLEENFAHLKYKIKSIYNIVSPNLISELSNVNSIDNCMSDKSYVNILTVARLSYEKGIDMAIESCKQLVNKGYKIRWYVLGEGREREALEKLIESEKLEEVFKLLGIRENPYPYIKQTDLYVQPSRYEGKSIAIDEAKILNRPIIVTNFNTAKDQIEHGVNGLIVSMNAKSISSGIETMLKDVQLRENLRRNLSKENLGTEGEIYKLYDVL